MILSSLLSDCVLISMVLCSHFINRVELALFLKLNPKVENVEYALRVSGLQPGFCNMIFRQAY